MTSNANINRDVEKLIAQTRLFHQKILAPSIILNGIRLRRDIHELSIATGIMIEEEEPFGTRKDKKRNRKESTTFVNGPARAVIPTILLSASPDIITDPGDTSFIIGENIDKNVIKAPRRVNLNSAHRP